MPFIDRPCLIVAALVLGACSRPDDKAKSREDAAAVESTFRVDPRRVSVDTAGAPRAADSARRRRPDSVSRTQSKPPARMAPGERTDKTPSIPVNPPVVKPD